MVLIGYWPLNESSGSTAYDHSGNENHGTINDGGDSTVPGANGILGQNAYSFDGSNDYVDISELESSLRSAPTTISLWVKTSSTSAQWFFSYQGNNFELGYNARTSSYEFNIYDGSHHSVESSVTSTGNWHHMVGVWNGSQMKLYFDGKSKGTASAGTPNSGDGPSIGAWLGNPDSYPATEGKITEVRLYNRILTPQEVQYLYTASQRGRQATSRKSS